MFNTSTVRDRISMFSNAPALRAPSFDLVNKVQGERPEVQILALATALTALSEAIGMNPHDIITIISKAKGHIDGPFSTQYKALQAYAQGEFN